MDNRSVDSAGGQKREGDGWSRGRTLLLAIRIGKCLFSEDALIIMSTNGPACSSLVWTESPSENTHLAKAAASGQKGAVKGNEVFSPYSNPFSMSGSELVITSPLHSHERQSRNLPHMIAVQREALRGQLYWYSNLFKIWKDRIHHVTIKFQKQTMQAYWKSLFIHLFWML